MEVASWSLRPNHSGRSLQKSLLSDIYSPDTVGSPLNTAVNVSSVAWSTQPETVELCAELLQPRLS